MGLWRWESKMMRRIMEKLPITAIRRMRMMRVNRNRPILVDGPNAVVDISSEVYNPNKMKSVNICLYLSIGYSLVYHKGRGKYMQEK